MYNNTTLIFGGLKMEEILNSKFNISKKISIAFTRISSLAFTMMLFLIMIGCTDNSNSKNNSSITSSDFISESQVNNSTLIESNFELTSSEVQKQATTEKSATEKSATEKAAAEKAAAEKAATEKAAAEKAVAGKAAAEKVAAEKVAAEKAAAEKAAAEKAAAEKVAAEKAAAEKSAAEKAAAEKAAAEKAKRIREIDNEISLKKNQIEKNNQQISDLKGTRNYYQSLLSQALSDLSYARNNKIRVYVSGVGWIYQTDQNAISAAESRVNTYKSYVNQCDVNITSLNESNYLLKQEIAVLEEEKKQISDL